MHVAKGVVAVSHWAAIYLKDPVLREFYLFCVFLIKASHSNCHLLSSYWNFRLGDLEPFITTAQIPFQHSFFLEVCFIFSWKVSSLNLEGRSSPTSVSYWASQSWETSKLILIVEIDTRMMKIKMPIHCLWRQLKQPPQQVTHFSHYTPVSHYAPECLLNEHWGWGPFTCCVQFSLFKPSKAKSKEIIGWFPETFAGGIDRMGKITATFKCKIRLMFYSFLHSSSSEDFPPQVFTTF